MTGALGAGAATEGRNCWGRGLPGGVSSIKAGRAVRASEERGGELIMGRGLGSQFCSSRRPSIARIIAPPPRWADTAGRTGGLDRIGTFNGSGMRASQAKTAPCKIVSPTALATNPRDHKGCAGAGGRRGPISDGRISGVSFTAVRSE